MAMAPSGPYKRVPDWALLAVQWIPESIADIQTSKPLYISEPGRHRNRKATDGEREMVAIVALKKLGKTWSEISTILRIPRRALEVRRDEIIRVIRDLEQLGNTEKVFLGKCQTFNDAWEGHKDGGQESGKRTGAKGDEDWSEMKTFDYNITNRIETDEQGATEEVIKEAIRAGDIRRNDAHKYREYVESTLEPDFNEQLERAYSTPLRDDERVPENANSDLSPTKQTPDCTEILD
jgi:hypothetical protein